MQLFKDKTALVVTALVFVTTATTFAQNNSIQLMGKEYRFENGKWYTYFQGRIGDEIIPRRVVVRLKDRGDVNSALKKYRLSDLGSAGRRYLDGYYVLTIAADKDPIQTVSQLEELDIFDVIEFDAYGKYLKTPDDEYYGSQWNLPKISMGQA